MAKNLIFFFSFRLSIVRYSNIIIRCSAVTPLRRDATVGALDIIIDKRRRRAREEENNNNNTKICDAPRENRRSARRVLPENRRIVIFVRASSFRLRVFPQTSHGLALPSVAVEKQRRLRERAPATATTTALTSRTDNRGASCPRSCCLSADVLRPTLFVVIQSRKL